jgi:D-alanyl-D-alanine carboxypeptidase
MASLTKIMTCIVALDIAKKYNLNLNEEIVTIGLFEQNIGGTSANIKKG